MDAEKVILMHFFAGSLVRTDRASGTGAKVRRRLRVAEPVAKWDAEICTADTKCYFFFLLRFCSLRSIRDCVTGANRTKRGVRIVFVGGNLGFGVSLVLCSSSAIVRWNWTLTRFTLRLFYVRVYSSSMRVQWWLEK